MSVVQTQHQCSCGATLTEWQRWDLGGYEVVHGEGDDAPTLFFTDEAAREGQGKVNEARIAEWIDGVHERAGIVVPKRGYLFVGGPKDGERIELADTRHLLRFPRVTGGGQDYVSYEYDIYERGTWRYPDGKEEYRYVYKGQ